MLHMSEIYTDSNPELHLLYSYYSCMLSKVERTLDGNVPRPQCSQNDFPSCWYFSVTVTIGLLQHTQVKMSQKELKIASGKHIYLG